MIRQRTDKNSIDRTVQKDVQQVGALLKQIAEKIDLSPAIQSLTTRTFQTEGKQIIDAEPVFLTEKHEDDAAIQRIKSWVGLKDTVSDKDLFSGKVTGNVKADDTFSLKIQLYHFDHYPTSKLSDLKKVLKIIIYDPSYEQTYENWNLAREIITKDPALCILVNIQPVEIIVEEDQLNIESLYTRHFTLGDLGTSISEIVDDDDFKHKIQIAKLKNHVTYLDHLYKLILLDIKDRTRQLEAKNMLTHKKQWQNQNSDAELSSRDVSQIKSTVNTKLKQITKTIERAIDDFEKEDEEYSRLNHEISSFLGFVERKSGKYLTFMMSDGAITDKITKANTVLSNFFDKIVLMVDGQFKILSDHVGEQLSAWQLQLPKHTITQDKKINTEEFLLDHTINSGKSYEKQIPAKGIGGLLTELRTPLFMLMPFMMIFALFGALVSGGDEGVVDRAKKFNDGKPCIAITKLPESSNNQYLNFITVVEDQRSKGFFNKEISDELTTEAQLAVIEEEVSKSFGEGTEIRETLDYDFDNEKSIVYLYLNEDADRNFVTEKLFDPSAKLLKINSSSRVGFGMGGIIRAMSGLKDYRYLILVGLSSLIIWFIVTRKRSMKRETSRLKDKEQKKLNEDLRVTIDKNVRQQLQRWKSKLFDDLNARQIVLQQTLEEHTNQVIERSKQKKAQELKIIQKRVAAIKNEKTLLTSLRSEQRKVDSKLNELKVKMIRLS